MVRQTRARMACRRNLSRRAVIANFQERLEVDINFASGIPVLPALDLAKALEFYVEMMGFKMIIDLDDYAGVQRGAVQIHFWLTDDPQFPANSSCRIEVTGIDDLYNEYASRE
jgi:hypothetical protein